MKFLYEYQFSLTVECREKNIPFLLLLFANPIDRAKMSMIPWFPSFTSS